VLCSSIVSSTQGTYNPLIAVIRSAVNECRQISNKTEFSTEKRKSGRPKKDRKEVIGSRLREIIIDGESVGNQSGNFNFEDVLDAVAYFQGKKHLEVRVMFPKKYKNIILNEIGKEASRALTSELGILNYESVGKIGGKTVVPDHGGIILQYAHLTGNAIIVSNDLFKDMRKVRQEYKDIVKNRLLKFQFVKGEFTVPILPRGDTGPSLDEFLKY